LDEEKKRVGGKNIKLRKGELENETGNKVIERVERVERRETPETNTSLFFLGLFPFGLLVEARSCFTKLSSNKMRNSTLLGC
jgi:hypothetical protein